MTDRIENSEKHEALEEKIHQQGQARRKHISELLDDMQDEYKALLNEAQDLLNNHEGIRWEELDMIRRLSQYGEGLHAVGKAYSAINPVGCNNS